MSHNMLKSKSEEQQIPSLQSRLRMLEEAEHKGPVRSANPREKISDEDLQTIFNRIKAKWYRIEDLKEALDGLVTVNTRDPKRSPINSSYLRRLRRLTGYKWRQKRGVDANGRTLVKVYVRKG